jgi:VPDSG-CTERM motif
VIGRNQQKDITQMKMINVTKWAVVIACVGFMALASQVGATSLTFTDIHVLGTVSPGAPADDADVATYVDFMISLPAPGAGTFSGQAITRSSNLFASLPNAVVTNVDGTSTTFDLGTGLYSYLFAKYDGQNDLSQVWFVGDLSGSVTIPLDGPEGHGLSGWILFGPGGGQVPDGGSTVMLLGAALTGLGVARRYLKH